MHLIECYEYVNRPYEDVSLALRVDGAGVFQRATGAAASRARALVSTLHVSVGGFDIGKDVVIRVTRTRPYASVPARVAAKATSLDLEWHAERGSAFFPTMRATLTAYPLTPGETQLHLRGTYDPPGGALGDVADAMVGKRIAEASMHRFLEEVATRLGVELDSALDRA